MSEWQLAEVRQHSEWHGWYYIVVKSFKKNISRNHPKRVHTSQIRRCQGRTGADESKGAVKKGAGIGGYGVCQERIKKSK